MSPFAEHLARAIRLDGPLRLDRFMGLANAQYYAARDPLGAAGDFTTAPEISQLFGEMLGLCLVDAWERSGAPAPIRLVELGPGRGTLMADMLRAAKIRPAFLEAARVTLVETSPALRARQAEALKTWGDRVTWADSFDETPDDAPLWLVANEFFDALPIRQFVRLAAGWAERVVALGEGGRFIFGAAPAPDMRFPQAPEGAVIEINEPAAAIAAAIGARLATRGGLALIVDYGHAVSAPGDTLQAMRAHRFAPPLESPGEVDLTAHVDFAALARAAAVPALGPVTQGALLTALGAGARAEALARARPDQADAIREALDRLVAPGRMGDLFKALALVGRGVALPAGFPA